MWIKEYRLLKITSGLKRICRNCILSSFATYGTEETAKRASGNLKMLCPEWPQPHNHGIIVPRGQGCSFPAIDPRDCQYRGLLFIPGGCWVANQYLERPLVPRAQNRLRSRLWLATDDSHSSDYYPPSKRYRL